MRSFKTAWSLLWSIPMCAVWILMYAMLCIGWGPKKAEHFIIYWNKMVEHEDNPPLEIG